MLWVYDDGGRARAGYTGRARDCVVRAIAIATGLPYKQVYMDLFEETKANERLMKRLASEGIKNVSPRYGVYKEVYRHYLEDHLGWKWYPTMHIGQGCTVHLRTEELPLGRIIVRLSRHLAAVIDGIIYDTHDPSRNGTRCVYGYWKED